MAGNPPCLAVDCAGMLGNYARASCSDEEIQLYRIATTWRWRVNNPAIRTKLPNRTRPLLEGFSFHVSEERLSGRRGIGDVVAAVAVLARVLPCTGAAVVVARGRGQRCSGSADLLLRVFEALLQTSRGSWAPYLRAMPGFRARRRCRWQLVFISAMWPQDIIEKRGTWNALASDTCGCIPRSSRNTRRNSSYPAEIFP